jgi:hypothetical protein
VAQEKVMKTKGNAGAAMTKRSLREHVVTIARSPLGREIAVAALVAVATALTRADRRKGLLKTLGRDLSEVVIASLAPVIDELLRPAGKKKPRAAE